MENEQITLNKLTAIELGERISTGSLKAVDLVESYLAVISAREPEVNAWAWHEPEFVRMQAKTLDEYRASGRPIGRLHGLPVGIKDIIDTEGIPTENGTTLEKGRVPEKDAWIVKRLKAEGAVIMGKTVTAELAYLDPGKTRNPHAPSHTPGGSSSGSAAAVASGMVPLAIGTQTGGSVIRPAAYCGITGFKPSFGAIPRSGVLNQSQSLDTVGVFGRRPEDCALLAETLFGFDSDDPDSSVQPHPKLLETALSEPPVTPTFAFIKPPGWENAGEETKAAFAEIQEFLGEEHGFSVELPQIFNNAEDLRKVVNFAEMSRNFHRFFKDRPNKMGEKLTSAYEDGLKISAKDYLAALDWKEVLYSGLAEIFERSDAIITPSSPTPAPKGLESTGDGIFNGLWTFTGVPAVTIPGMASASGLPMGIQLVGARWNDGRLLRTANWLLKKIESI